MDTIIRPSSKETEEDLLRLQQEFAKDPSTKPSVSVIKKSTSAKKVSFQDKERNVEVVSIPVLSEIREKNLDVKEFRFRPPKSVNLPKPVPESDSFSERDPSFPSSSPIIMTKDGDGEAANLESMKRDVHLENVNRLSEMSPEEIMQQQQELLKKLDPKLVEFIKRRKEITINPMAPDKPKDPPPSLAENPALPLDEFPIKPTTEWPHMDQPEPEKMAWMGSIPAVGPAQEFYSARFDFKGRLVPRTADVSVAAGLHHHGAEPEAAGYTLDELLRLCRAQALNQRALALNTLANIVRLAKSGAYDNSLKPPSLMKSLLESNVCTIMRYALDDSAESVVVAACNLIAAFMHSLLDEACLDMSYGLSIDTSQLSLAPSDDDEDGDLMSKMAEEQAMDDEASCNKDMVLGLLRMGILERLRHGAKASAKMLDCSRLMHVITKQFLPKAWRIESVDSKFYPSYKMPYWAAVKLCRIIVASTKELAVALVEKYEIGDSMIRYLITEPDDMMIPLPEACQLVIESYRLWSQLLTYGICDEYFSDLFETMMNHLRAAVALQPLGPGRQFVWDRAAALALVVGKFVKLANKSDASNCRMQLTGIIDVITMALMKFLRDGNVVVDISYYYLIASLANCVGEAVASKCVPMDPERLRLIANDLIPRFQSSFGDRFMEETAPPANVAVHASERDPPSLPSLESAGGETLIALLRDGSMYPVFMALRRVCRAIASRVSD